MVFQALYFWHFPSFYTMQLEPPKYSWVWLPGFVFWWRVSALVSLSGLWPPALLSGVLARCPVVSCTLCCVLRCSAALWCCLVRLCCTSVRAAGVCYFFCPLPLCQNPLLFLCTFENFLKTIN